VTSVYVLDCDHGVKVGITSHLDARLGHFQHMFGFAPRLLRTWDFDLRFSALTVEQDVHEDLRDCRTVGEWFHCHPLEAVEAVERSIQRWARRRERE
jgi:hypothetical protein